MDQTPTAPDRAPESAALTDDERRSLGCTCTRLDDAWHHQRACPVPAVERILTGRLEAVRTFHTDWGFHPEGQLDELGLWERLGRILDGHTP